MLRKTVLIVAIAAGLFSFARADYPVYKDEAEATTEKLTDRIVGGKVIASPNEFPHMVSILNRGVHFCGGSIIEPNVILTAAHCMDGMEGSIPYLEIVAGTTEWARGGTRRKASTFMCNRDWNRLKMDSDVCLIKLQSPFIFSSVIKAIKLATQTPRDGTPLVLSGFGLVRDKGQAVSPILKAVDLQCISKERCRGPQFLYGREGISDHMLCGFAMGEGSCQGDSGGPLLDKMTGEQVGIVSFGMDCADPRYPGVYADVATLFDWIQSVARILQRF